MRLRIVWHRGQVLASAEIIAPHARHDVILAMTLPRRPHSFAGSWSGICIDTKWFGDRLQLAGCRKQRTTFRLGKGDGNFVDEVAGSWGSPVTYASGASSSMWRPLKRSMAAT